MLPSSPIGRPLLRYAPFIVLAVATVVAASCAKQGALVSDFDSGGGGNPEPGNNLPPGTGDATIGLGMNTPSGGSGGGGGGAGGIVFRPDASHDKCTTDNPCHDFPAMPEFAGAAPMTAPTMFGAPGNGAMTGGPCLAEPADGALYPKNWLRPRILWVPTSAAQTLFEVRIHADGEANDYVVYTDQKSWTMPKAVWQTIAYTPGNPSMDGSLMGRTLTVTVRGMAAGGGTPAISNSAQFTIAPAIADGALIYWTTAGFDNSATNTTLAGFQVGDEGTAPALKSSQVQQPVRGVPVDGGNLTSNFSQVWCIGCHTATPDGNYVAFTAQWPWAVTLASIQAASPGTVPPWMSKGAVQNLSPDYKDQYPWDVWYNPPAINQLMLGIGTFSPAHYATGDRIYVATLGTSWNSFTLIDPGVPSGVTSQLAWFNLEWDNATSMAGGIIDSGLPVATPCTQQVAYPGINGGAQPCLPAAASDGGWGIIARTGDPNGAGSPSWSHNADGNTDMIAYASTNTGVKDGRLDCSVGTSCMSDVYVVPYGAGKGGASKPLPGASDKAYNEYYPAWSPDDKYIAFNRVAAGTSMYNQAKADVYVVPYNGGMGGMAQPLVSNTPVACTGFTAGTVQNTWPKWAPNPLGTDADGGAGVPTPQVIDGKTYYWLTFSSIRSVTSPPDATNGGKRKQQLYVTGMVVDNATGAITTYAPVYLWNQDSTVNNLIPAWGEFSIPPGTMPPPPFEAGIAK